MLISEKFRVKIYIRSMFNKSNVQEIGQNSNDDLLKMKLSKKNK